MWVPGEVEDHDFIEIVFRGSDIEVDTADSFMASSFMYALSEHSQKRLDVLE